MTIEPLNQADCCFATHQIMAQAHSRSRLGLSALSSILLPLSNLLIVEE